MTQTNSAPQILSALVAMQLEISETGIAKTLSATDKSGKELYKARGIDAVYNLLSPLFAKHGIVIGFNCLKKEREAVQTKHSIQYQTFLTVEYTFTASSDGSSHSITVFGEANDNGDKGTAKALSMAFKCACFQVFCIPVCEDPDATVHDKISNADYSNSKQDMRHSMIRVDNQEKISKEQAQGLFNILQSNNQDIKGLLQHFNVQNLSDFTVPMYESTMNGLKEAGITQQQVQLISKQQVEQLAIAIQQGGWTPRKLLSRHGVNSLNELPASAFDQTMQSIHDFYQEQQLINQQPHQNQQGANNGQQQQRQQHNGTQQRANDRNRNYS